jgi:TPP-dependent pyruvate/acetoin dehydrogenase alpha subunit
MVRERAGALLAQRTLTKGLLEFGSLEAIEVGATFDLRDDDALSVYPGDLVTPTLKGRSLQEVFAQLQGERKSRNRQRELNRMTPVGIIPTASTAGAQFNFAAGVALAYKCSGKRNVVLAVFDRGFDALGSWHDAARLAGEHRLPLIFVVQSDRVPYENGGHWFGSPASLSDRAHDYGFPGIPVDGDDVVAVFRVTQESIHRARNGGGPTLIECKSSHRAWGVQKHINGARPSAPRASDPIAHMEHYLKKRKAWSPSSKQGLVERITAEIDEAVEATAGR